MRNGFVVLSFVLSMTVPRLLLRNSAPVALVAYTGPVSGSINFLSTNTLNLTTVGTYTFTTTSNMTLQIKAAATGCDGGTGSINGNGASGGRAGGVNSTGQNYSFANGIVYEVRVAARNSADSTYIKIQAGAVINELNSGCGNGLVPTGTGIAGGAGGSGGTYNSVSPDGNAPGTFGGAQGGGGAGTVGASECGNGYAPGGGNGQAPPCNGGQGTNGLGVLVAGIMAAYGGGGGQSGSFNFSVGGQGGPAALALSFVSLP